MKQIAVILYSSQEDEIDLPYPSVPRFFKMMLGKLCLHFWAKCRGGLVLITFKRCNIHRLYLQLCTAQCSYITRPGTSVFLFFVPPSNKSDSLGMFSNVVVFWKFNSTTSGASQLPSLESGSFSGEIK